MHLSKAVSAINPFIVRLPLSEPKRGHDVWSATVAFEQREDGIYTGVSLRSPKDVYDGALGAKIAVGRASNKRAGDWYATWAMLAEDIQVPEIPVSLYRLWACELAQIFIVRNIHRHDNVDAFGDLGLCYEQRGYMDGVDYREWFGKKAREIIRYVYDN